MTNVLKKIKVNPPFHIVKRTDIPKWKSFLIKLAAVFGSLLVCGIISSIIKPNSFGLFFQEMFKGCFSTPRRVLNLLQETAMLLCIALAITPAFKMKFWNIGAEGQVLMGALMCATCMKFMGGKVNDAVIVLVCLVLSIAGGALWAVVPAIFKAKWNTNETLFTLMMNYIAMGLIAFVITVWVKSGSGVVGILPNGHLPYIGGYPYIINLIVVALVTVFMAAYLRFSKHGYELTVVGESINTAKYIGINVKKVIIRTMLLSGAVCGIAGWLIVSGSSHTISSTIAGNRGFTAILISWLAHFNPLVMVITSFLVAFLSQGSTQAASAFDFGGSFNNIITAVFFFILIASEFFVDYKIKFNFTKGKKEDGEAANDAVNANEGAVSSDEVNDDNGVSFDEVSKANSDGETNSEISDELSEDPYADNSGEDAPNVINGDEPLSDSANDETDGEVQE